MTDIKTTRHEKQLQVAAAVEQQEALDGASVSNKKLNFNPLLRPEERDPDFNPFNQTFIKPNTFVLIRLPSENFRVVKMTPTASINLGKFGSFRVHDILGHPFGYTYEIFGIGPEEKGLVKNQKVKKGLKKLTKEEKRKLYEQQKQLQGEDEQAETVPPPGPQLRIVQGLDTMEEGGASTKDELDPDENNKDLMYDPQAMKLTMAEIEALKRSSVDAGREVISSMIKAHSSFDKKTTFSQEKYVKRKEQKFLRRFAPEPINSAEILNLYLEKDPHKVLDMSEESLGLLLSLGNVKPGGTYLVAEDTSGLLVAALLERMAGQGTIVVAHANEHTRMDALKYLSVSDAWIESKVKTINWLDFLHPEEHDTGLESEGEDEDEEEQQQKGGGNNNVDEGTDIKSSINNTEPTTTKSSSADSSYFLYKFVEKTPQEIASMKPHQRGQYYRRKKRYDEFIEVRALIDSQAFDAAFLATELDLPTLAPRVVDSLKGSAPLVIYSQFKENLVATSHVLQKDLRVLAPTLLETKVRKYQTLPGRMHPVMTMRGGGGYLLWGTRVIPTQVDAIGGSRGKKRKAVESPSTTSQPKSNASNDIKDEPSSKQIKVDKD